MGGCQGPPDGHDLLPNASSTRVLADWDDINAAVDRGGTQAEMAVRSSSRRDESPRVFRLKTVQDQPVILVIAREDGSPGAVERRDEPVPMLLRSTVGWFGDHAREERLLGGVKKRLEELRGKLVWPLD